MRRNVQLAGSFLDLLKFLDRRSGDRQVVFDEVGHLVAQDAAHHQYRDCDAGLSQQQAFFENGDSQIVCLQVLHQPGNRHQSMTVSVGFQDGHRFCRRHFFFDRPEIPFQALQVDFDQRGSHHVLGRNRRVVDVLHGRILSQSCEKSVLHLIRSLDRVVASHLIRMGMTVLERVHCTCSRDSLAKLDVIRHNCFTLNLESWLPGSTRTGTANNRLPI